MPYMNEIFELLARSHEKLMEYDNMLLEHGMEDMELNMLSNDIKQMLHEWECLKVGNIARI